MNSTMSAWDVSLETSSRSLGLHSSYQGPASGSSSLLRLMEPYLLIPPLIVFAVHGGFSFEHSSWNNGLGAVSHGIGSASTQGEVFLGRVQSWIALFLCLLVMLFHSRGILQECMSAPIVLVLNFYAFASAWWSQDASASLRSSGFLLFSTLFALFLAERFSPDEQMQLLMKTGWCVFILSIALVFVAPQYALDHQLHEGAWQGIFTQKNVCAQSVLFLTTPAFSLPFVRPGERALRVGYLFCALLIITMTQSRTAWATTVVYIGFIAGLRFIGRFERRQMIPIAGLALLLIAFGGLLSLQFVPALIEASGRSADFSGRSQIWAAVSASISKRPLTGYGFDAFWSVFPGEAFNVFLSAGWAVTGAHCGYLNVLLEVGFAGAFLLLLSMLRAVRHASICFRPERSPYVDWCIGIIFLTLLYNLDERTLMATQYLPWMLYLLACTGLAKMASDLRQSTTGNAKGTE